MPEAFLKSTSNCLRPQPGREVPMKRKVKVLVCESFNRQAQTVAAYSPMTFKVQRESLATAEELKTLHRGPGTPKNLRSETTPYFLGLMDRLDRIVGLQLPCTKLHSSASAVDVGFGSQK